MKPIDYLHLQMRLEGIETGNGNLITRTSPDVNEFPFVILACTSDKQKFVYFDDSLPVELYNKLSVGDLQPFKIESAVEVFNLFGISTKSGRFKTYIFLDNFAITDIGNVKCYSKNNPKVVTFGFGGFADEVFAIEQEGMILSACMSSRQNSRSAEAWVFTHPDHRRKGLAQQVVTAWAVNLKREGIIPFYSHEVGNTNSAKLAGKLNLIYVFDETVIEKAA